MVFGKIEGRKAWKLSKEEIQVVNEYTHLGVIMATITEGRKRIDEGLKTARRAMFAKCSQGLNIDRTSPLMLHTTWKMCQF